MVSGEQRHRGVASTWLDLWMTRDAQTMSVSYPTCDISISKLPSETFKVSLPTLKRQEEMQRTTLCDVFTIPFNLLLVGPCAKILFKCIGWTVTY